MDKRAKEYWAAIDKWASTYKPKDRGMQYAFDVVYGNKYVVCEAMEYSAKRQILYLYRSIHDPDFPIVYNSNRINSVLALWNKLFILKEGAFRGPFKLEDTQAFKISLIWGFNFKEKTKTGVIRFVTKYLYDCEARKQGKSIFYAALSILYGLDIFGNDAHPEVYFSGPMKDTSDILFEKARLFITNNKELQKLYPTNNLHRINSHKGGKLRKLAFKKENLEGKNHSFGVATEFHLHRTELMLESFESATNESRPNSLIAFDTTKGNDLTCPAYYREKEYKEFIKMQVEQPWNFIFYDVATYIAELDDTDDVEDYTKWVKANPMLGITQSLDNLRNEWAKAKRKTSSKIEFITKKLGRWYGRRESLFSIQDLVDANEKYKNKYDVEKLKGEQAFVSVDLAQSGDTNSVTLTFRDRVDNQDIPIFYNKIFIPADTLDDRVYLEKAPYHDWIKQGHVMVSGKKGVNYKDIASYIKRLTEEYDVKTILYDPYQWTTIKTLLVDLYGLPESLFEAVPQSYREVSDAMDILINKIKNKQLYTFSNPVVNYQFLNVSPKFNSQGYIYYDKTQEKNRIDAFVTCVLPIKFLTDLKALGVKSSPGFTFITL